jgi:prophage tail gpP-like protein
VSRPLDTVRVEADGVGSFDKFTTFQISNDLTSPSEAAFEVGDDLTYPQLSDFVALGKKYRVFVNSRLSLTGRIEINNIPTDAQGGASVRFTVRTKLADALFASARADAKVKNVTLKQWLLELYAPLGYVESDFVFKANVARNLITGKSTKSNQGALPDPDTIKEEQAKVQPPEAIFAAADRHLRRFGLMHWDSPDGKIVVSAPDDEQEPLYHFRCFRGPSGAQNNVLSITHGIDFSEIPSGITVAGSGAKASEGFVRAKVIAQRIDADVTSAGFVRPVTILAQQVRTTSLAQAAAARELSARSQRKNTFDVAADGLSHWDGSGLINYAPDTVADVVSDTVGGALGLYYVHRTSLTRSPQDGDRSQITVLKQGIWRLS